MKILQVEHKNHSYEFRLLEQAHVVQVVKDEKPTYTIRPSVGMFQCDCPGAVFWHKCWHVGMIGQLKQQPRITEPWAQWAEEAGMMTYRKET